MNTTTKTTTYKYHIYELVKGKWICFDTWLPPQDSDRARRIHINWLTKKQPCRTFKLVTEKITITSEFIEDSNEPT